MKKIVVMTMIILSIGLYADESSDIKNLKKECSNGNGLSCVKVGARYQLKKDFKKAKVYYKKASALDFGYGYMMLGGIYDREKNFKSALKYYKKGCSKGVVDSCKLAHALNADMK